MQIGGRKSGRSYTDALGQPLRKPVDDTVVDAPGREPDRVRDRAAVRVAVRDHREAAQAEQVRAAVGVRIEPVPEAAGGRLDQEAAELADAPSR